MSKSLREKVHGLFPRTFSCVVASPGRVTCILLPRAYGKWKSSMEFRTQVRRALEPSFRHITIVAPPKSKPYADSSYKVLADWERIDAGAMY